MILYDDYRIICLWQHMCEDIQHHKQMTLPLSYMNHHYGIYSCDVREEGYIGFFSLFTTLQPVSLELNCQKLDNLIEQYCVELLNLSRQIFLKYISLTKKGTKNQQSLALRRMCTYVSNIECFIRQINYPRCYDKVSDLDRKPLVFNRLPTITILFRSINNHKPPPYVAMEIFWDMLQLIHSRTQWYQHNFLEMFQSYLHQTQKH